MAMPPREEAKVVTPIVEMDRHDVKNQRGKK
jgi:hypothetical protein